MKAWPAAAVGMALLIWVGPGFGAENQPEVPAAQASNGAFVLEDGTRVWLTEDRVVQLQEGATVDLSYEERNGEHVLTSIESAE